MAKIMDQEPLSNQECHLFKTRGVFLIVCLIISFGVTIARLWHLQIAEGKTYLNYADGNRVRLAAEGAPRGFIYDRYGKPLADNRPVYELSLIREDAPNLEETLRNLSYVLNKPYSDLKKIVDQNKNSAPFKPIILQSDLTYEQAVLLEVYESDFLGATLRVQSRRYYPYQNHASHILGYVSQRQENQATKIPKEKRISSMMIGQTGIEKISNEALVGTDGGRQVEVDHVGRELKTLGKRILPTPGKDIHLTIDIGLQQKINELMEGHTGAVLVMRPQTGEILAMGSFPTFNPNLFADGISHQHWKALLSHPENPLENKTIQGIYPPGSLFKMVTAYAALDLGIIDSNTTYKCNGFFYVKGRKSPFKCWAWRKGGHGKVNLKKAIKESCNVYFYRIAMEITIDELAKYAKMFGFGKKTGITLPDEKSGILPTAQWKLETLGENWYKGETVTVGIGQGYLNVTPMQVANFMNILASNGQVVRPKLILSAPTQTLKKDHFKTEYLSLLREGMLASVQEKHGTASQLKASKVTISAKTGTAQVIGHDATRFWSNEKKKQKDYQPHSWIASFTTDEPQISVVVLVEHGEGGAKYSGPIARQIYDYYAEHLRHKLTDDKPDPDHQFTKFLNNAFHSDS